MPLMFGSNIKVFPDAELVLGGMQKNKKMTWSILGLGEGQKCPQIVIKIAP